MNHDTYFYLLKLIGEYAKTTDRLPPEETLAQQLGISRVKLRDILSVLQSNGYISRKRGIGTLINKHMLQEHARLDTDMVYDEMIAGTGHVHSANLHKIRQIDALPGEIRTKLELPPDETAWQIEKTTFVDGKPAIFSVDYIPSKYFHEADLDIALITQCNFFFVQQQCDDLMDSLILHIAAIAADEVICQRLALPQGNPVLQVCSVCYSQKLAPLMYSLEYYNTDLIPLSCLKRLYRTKLQQREQAPT